MLTRRAVLSIAAGGFPAIAAAQPITGGRPVTIIVPFAPGGGSDILARLLAPPLGAALGVPVVVENRPGAGGVLACRQAKAARPDGQTLLFVDMGFTAGASLDRQAGYHPVRDFQAIAPAASVASILTVRQGSDYGSLAALVAAGKRRPGALNMASGGTGGTAHLIGAMFAEQAGFEPTHVPYRGMGPAMTDVLAGQTDFLVATAPVALPNLQDRRAAGLAVASEERLPLLPDTMTFAQQGYPGMVADNVYGIVAPAGLPAATAATLQRAITAIVQTEVFRDRLAPLAAVPRAASDIQAYARFIEGDFEKWRDVIRRNNIAP